MAENGAVKVKVTKPFPWRSEIKRIGDTIEVPADKLQSLVDKGFVEAPEGSSSAQSSSRDLERIDKALATIGRKLPIERKAGESAADFLERLVEFDATQTAKREAEETGAARARAARERQERENAGDGGEGPGDTDLLDDEFPGVEVLRENGITTRSKVESMTDDQLIGIKGIGPATLKEIRSAQQPKA
ncbi:MAG TPA: hypothetical protein VF543_22420 [Pyrinomonadaceae bacterium]